MKNLKRPNCRRYLSLWDDEIWKRKNTFNNIPYINSNDFLFFLYETKHDLCCIDDNNGKVIRNAIDKFFNLLFDIGRFNCLPYRIYDKDKFIEIFQELVQKINKWNYWKKMIINTYAKIILKDYEYVQKNSPYYLKELITNIKQIFHNGLEM